MLNVILAAAIVDLMGSYSSSLIRAMVTCCVPLSEFGKVYSVVSALDNLLPLGLSQMYASLWKVSEKFEIYRKKIFQLKHIFKITSGTYPGATFLISAFFTFLTLCLAIYIHLSLRGKKFSEVVKTEELEKGDENIKSIFGFPPSYEEAMRSSI